MISPFDIYNQLADKFKFPEFGRFLLWAKLISYSISTLLIFSMIILLSRSRATWWVAERLDSFRKPNLPERMQKDWEKINDRLEKGDEASLKLAIIEADNMLEDVLKRMGMEGKDMGERLEQLNTEQFKSYNDVLEAHRLRNLIVHQKDILITKEQAERATKAYGEGLKELEVL
ncbi:MAG: hypothetical protein AUJ32_03030 [Parcubacteria group bacterium CG1_02_40_82]|uniref:DUF4145 domain-containing protein n=1 Tax=Candidatus Portnoybacteria bacterium CG_4_10_14_0_8_um_filter_40_50 TaxID=1974800 RepID=A0A2M7QSS5_9BACT|nr:MAG: hypothetical protein AUJ32_03030 [Parcubacteria group bacterium CG1_02_40_82]PIS31036.1 MAG: hypothetical protein COT41_02520 [Candidatus Portnoybacteria bacterium CG08_land_8_20_14_0_20_40_83]PIY75339.1 MAG: hypothetical protein COY85_00520 [Candidatus Portnoybacteria bacterium CG_4_10_14_0_8_um_filter_40_50]